MPEAKATGKKNTHKHTNTDEKYGRAHGTVHTSEMGGLYEQTRK